MSSQTSQRIAPPTRHSNRASELAGNSQLRPVPEVNSRAGSVLTADEEAALNGYDSDDDDMRMLFADDKTNKCMVECIKLAVQENVEKAEVRRAEFGERAAKAEYRKSKLKGRNPLQREDSLEEELLALM